MSDNKKKAIAEETAKNNKKKEISEDKLDEVVGGGVFSDIPRVPEKPIDDEIRNKI